MIAFAILAAGGAVTWLIRVTFINVVPSSRLPSIVRRAVEGVGPAAMAALIATKLSQHVQTGGTGETAASFGAAVVAGVVAWRTKRPALTVVVGIIAFWLFGAVAD
jgi:branched-subunit amino acid transport protein